MVFLQGAPPTDGPIVVVSVIAPDGTTANVTTSPASFALRAGEKWPVVFDGAALWIGQFLNELKATGTLDPNTDTMKYSSTYLDETGKG